MRLFAAVVLALTITTTAHAQSDTQANLDRAAAYWGASPNCPSGVAVIYDPAFVGPDVNERAGGCRIWIGDNYGAESPAAKCQTITHGWGHLLGWGADHAWHAGLPADPAGVMGTGAVPPACAALEPSPPPVAAAPEAPAVRFGWRTARSLSIAQVVWHPTCGALTLRYGDPIREGAGDGAGGWAWKGDCVIRIPNGSHYEFEELCTIILHEAGHVAGMGHSADPRSVMYPEHVVIKTTAHIAGRTVVRWNGVDRRCLNRGRPFLKRHGLL